MEPWVRGTYDCIVLTIVAQLAMGERRGNEDRKREMHQERKKKKVGGPRTGGRDIQRERERGGGRENSVVSEGDDYLGIDEMNT